MTQDLK